MKTKENVSDEDINEMLEEYKKLYVKKTDVDGMDTSIVYKGKLISIFFGSHKKMRGYGVHVRLGGL